MNNRIKKKSIIKQSSNLRMWSALLAYVGTVSFQNKNAAKFPKDS